MTKKAMMMATAVVALTAPAVAQEDGASNYPAEGERISFLVPLSPGGSTDTWARILADGLSKHTGARIQVVNDTGAGGMAPYLTVIGDPTNTSQISNFNIPAGMKYLYPDAQADFGREDFAPVACTGYSPNVLVANAESDYSSLEAVIEAARNDPGALNAAADGALSEDAIAYANLEQAAEIDVNTVIVDGSAQKVTELLAGRIDFFAGAITGVLPQVQAGDFRVLAVLADERSEFLPDAPTSVEQGVDVTSFSNFCVTMGAGAPEDAVAGLEAAIQAVAEDPAYIEANENVGMQVRFLGSEEMAAHWAEQEEMVRSALEDLQ